MKKWKCTVCGYIHSGEEPPDTCPVCGADKSLFVLLDESGEVAADEVKEASVDSAPQSTKKWHCQVCGYVHQGDDPPEKCPVCGADKSMFDLIEENGQPVAPSEPGPVQEPPSPTIHASKWRCTVCGYVHNGSEPPERCPVCGADKSKFVPVVEDEEPAPKQPHQAADASPEAKPQGALSSPFPPQFANIADALTKFHGHPIAVHIPNGLLPVCVLFTLVAVMFDSAAFATAAKLNTILVFLTMPLVIGTGIVDWKNRFGGNMTNVFKVKMVCAAIVTLLTLILSIWWIAVPDVYTGGVSGNLFFLFLYFTDVAAAGIAGWYGGKLVFHN